MLSLLPSLPFFLSLLVPFLFFLHRGLHPSVRARLPSIAQSDRAGRGRALRRGRHAFVAPDNASSTKPSRASDRLQVTAFASRMCVRASARVPGKPIARRAATAKRKPARII